MADDPGETIVVDPTGVGDPHPEFFFANGGAAASPAKRDGDLVAGTAGGGPPGSSGNPISDQTPQIFQLAPQPINNIVVPGGSSAQTTIPNFFN